MKKLIIALLIIPNICFASITTLSLIEKQGITTTNYPLTFGHVFKKGDVRQGVEVQLNGNFLPSQCDAKTTYPDGSVRFAVISIIIPTLTAKSSNTIALYPAPIHEPSGYLGKPEILAANVRNEIRLTDISGSGYSGNLTANLTDTITNHNFEYWLKGGVTTEILVRQKLNNSLEASWEVRFYPGTSFGPRISHSIENMNAGYRGHVSYAVDIQAGTPALKSIYSKLPFLHNESSRWRKVIWIGNEPPETELHYDLPYLISSGAVMNYDTSLTVSESTISSSHSIWESKDHDIMGNGVLEKYFPKTGGRKDIGMLPTWSARYLLSMDNRLKKMVLNSGEMASSGPIHYRESNPDKAFYKHPVSIDDRPTVWTTASRASSYGDRRDRLPPPVGSVSSKEHGWSIDRAHQGSFTYLPYLITGEKYYLDEMYYWAAWCLSAMDYNSSWGRDSSNGLIRDQVRGEAWALRNIVDAAAFAQDNSLEKKYLNAKVSHNIVEWEKEKDRYPLNHWGVDKYATVSGLDKSYVKYPTSPWMEDFMLLSLSHAKRQGFETQTILAWYSTFIINRMTHFDFNHFNGTPYRFPTELRDGSYVSSWSQANDLFMDQPTSFPADDYPNSYRFIAMAAASTITDYPNGFTAYNFLKTHVKNQQDLNKNPTWAIVPVSTFKIKPIAPINFTIK